MTEVAGPPVPAGRFSLLPILGRTAAIGAGTCGSKIEVSCGMAQAFDIPMGDRTAANGSSQAGAVMASIFTDRPLQPKRPVRISPVGNMGQSPVPCKRAHCTATGPTPDLGDPTYVNQFRPV